MRFMTKGSTMQRHARRLALGSRKLKLTHACRQVLIDQLESRVLLSTGGTPDPGFGQGGYLKGYQVLVVQQDGSLIANEDSASGTSSLVLLYPDGSFESAYSGPAQPTLPNNVQADGKYLVINGSNSTLNNSLTRDNPDGSVDTSFGNNGTVSDFTSGTGYPAGSFNPENVAIVGNHILVGGPLNLGGEQQTQVPALVTLNLDGSIDQSFGSSGIAKVIPPDHLTSNPPVSYTPGPLIVRDDDRIFVSNNYTFADGTSADYVISYLPDWGANTSVSGFVYQDVNFNGIYDSGDQPLRYWKVYVDLNQNGSQNAFEPTAYTDYNGYYKIHGLQPGTYNVRVVGGIRTFSWAETTPYSPPLHTFTVSTGQVATGNDFGIYPIDQMSTLTGSVYYDTGSGSGTGIPNWTVYVDLNNNGILDPNEPSTPTDQSGNFTILTAVGTRVIRAVSKPGWTQTQPTNGSGQTVTITAGYNTSGVVFGETEDNTLDPWFANHGTLAGYTAQQVLPDGKILAHDSAGNLVRLNPDGSIDSTFNPATDVPPTPLPGVYQSDGKRLVLDTTNSTITRYNADGSIDSTFGTNGKFSSFAQQPTRYLGDPTDGTYQNTTFVPKMIALQGTNIIVLGEMSGTFNGNPFAGRLAVERITSNGSQDDGFGVVTYAPMENVETTKLNALYVANGGQIYILGANINNDPFIVRISSDGTTGNDIIPAIDEPDSSALAPDGSLVIEGLVLGGYPPGMFEVDQFNADLSLRHETWIGPQIPNFDPMSDWIAASGNLLISPDGNIFISAAIGHDSQSDGNFLIRLSSLDPIPSISGYIYNDTNGNGVFDSGEPPLHYAQAFVDMNGNGKFDLGEPTGYADYTGYYQIDGVSPGSYRVYEVPQSGFTQDSPSARPYQTATVTAGNTATGVDFGNRVGSTPQPGSISGTFFYDSNTNGVWDSGEAPSPYWGVYIDANNDGRYDTGDTELIANGAGQYTFSNLAPGTYIIRGTTASGWTQTFPANGGGQAVTVGSGQAVTGINIGEFHGTVSAAKGSISGTFFYDSNTNGTWDSGEAPSPYWGVYIDANNDGKYDTGDTELIANGAGQYTFSNLAPGTYIVRGTTASGWTQTFPANGGGQTVTIGSGQAVTGINIGEFHGTVPTANGSISGTFFYDSNHNGVWDSGEPISPYWGVYIDANNDGKYDTGDTELIANGNGQFTFPNLPAGTYVIRGTTASGWTQTFPANGGAQVVTLAAGQNLSNINFGEYHGIVSSGATGSISGTFFYDSNANGVWDSGETYSPSWGVYIDANNDGVYDSGDTELIATAHGQYTFSNLSAGTYVIRATTATGWKQTYPANGGAQVITLAAGQNATGVNFGKVRT